MVLVRLRPIDFSPKLTRLSTVEERLMFSTANGAVESAEVCFSWTGERLPSFLLPLRSVFE